MSIRATTTPIYRPSFIREIFWEKRKDRTGSKSRQDSPTAESHAFDRMHDLTCLCSAFEGDHKDIAGKFKVRFRKNKGSRTKGKKNHFKLVIEFLLPI